MKYSINGKEVTEAEWKKHRGKGFDWTGGEAPYTPVTWLPEQNKQLMRSVYDKSPDTYVTSYVDMERKAKARGLRLESKTEF